MSDLLAIGVKIQVDPEPVELTFGDPLADMLYSLARKTHSNLDRCRLAIRIMHKLDISEGVQAQLRNFANLKDRD